MTTLYEWAGGAEAFERLIDAFYDRVEADDLLAGFFPGGVHAEHREHVAAWWSEVFGGRARTSPSTRRCPAGAGARRRRTSRERERLTPLGWRRSRPP